MKYLSSKDKLKLYWMSARNMSYLAGKKKVSPTMIAWLLTQRCNLTCKHCTSYLNRDKIEADKLMKIAQKLAESDTMIILLTGGEPMIIPNIKEIITLLKAHGKIVRINTNAYNLDKYADFLIEAGVDSIAISLDGADAKTHDYVREKEGSFDKAMENLRYLKKNRKNGIPHLGVRGVILQDNWKMMPDYMETFKDLADDINFQPVHNLERHHAVVEESVLFPEKDALLKAEFTALLNEVLKEHPSLNKSYYKHFPKFLFQPEEMEEKALHSCLITWMNFMPVAADGTCWSCTQQIGSLWENDVETIWSGQARRDYLVSMSKFGRCKTPCWLNCTGVAPTWVGQGVKKLLAMRDVSEEAYESFKKLPNYTGPVTIGQSTEVAG